MEPIQANGKVGDTEAVQKRIASVVDQANADWDDSWINWDGDESIPDGIPTLIGVWHVYAHVLKWGRETGRFPEDAWIWSHYQLLSRIGALCYRSYDDDYDLFEEIDRYVEERRSTTRERIYAERPHLRPFVDQPNP